MRALHSRSSKATEENSLALVQELIRFSPDYFHVLLHNYNLSAFFMLLRLTKIRFTGCENGMEE